jgi:hypothetical protein
LSLLASDTAATTPLLAAAGVAADTTTPSDATAIGGTRHSIPFTVTGMATRLLWSGPALVHGTYKVLARMSTTVPGSTYRVRVNNQYTTPRMLAGATISTMVTSWEWYDLGDMDWPAGARIDGEDFLAPSSTITAAFAVERLTGTGTLYVDAVVLVPVDMEDGQAKTMTVTYPSSEASPNGAFIDAASRSVRLVSSGDVPLQASVPATVLGDFLQVTPGKTNVLRMLATYNTSVAGGDSISTTATLLMSYYPQWLYLADL